MRLTKNGRPFTPKAGAVGSWLTFHDGVREIRAQVWSAAPGACVWAIAEDQSSYRLKLTKDGEVRHVAQRLMSRAERLAKEAAEAAARAAEEEAKVMRCEFGDCARRGTHRIVNEHGQEFYSKVCAHDAEVIVRMHPGARMLPLVRIAAWLHRAHSEPSVLEVA
ncbi:hypothetical protein ACFV9C_42490 [Kribbella sp. NPDC059898]|uniref:hypothetical protein n=1 Tax=Kribbella sp. NPDC059898 TaxID=3346995 RepID=UPI003652FB08